MSSIPETNNPRTTDTRRPGTIAEIRGAAVTALQSWASIDSPEHAAALLDSWKRRPEMTDADVTAVLEAMFPEPAQDPGVTDNDDYRDGYAEGYVDAVQIAVRGPGYVYGYIDATATGWREQHEEWLAKRTGDVVAAAVKALDGFHAESPEQALILLSMWARRAELTTDNVAEVVTTLYGADEVSAAVVSVWARRDQLTAIEVDAIRSMLDEGFAERFLERQQERRAAEVLPPASGVFDCTSSPSGAGQ